MFFRRGSGLSSEDARALVSKGARLLDVRSREEFAGGHLPGAVNIPVQELASRVKEVGAAHQPVVVYCAAGMRSARAAGILRGAGFTAVHDLGAMSRW
ncbi:MAG: rhodanese-like domain-containing protein [Deltaproteobacteria bacterium]|nr:rhodanese-like domain-containing protein [Deltaproteobacteria bacterium]